VCCWVLLSCTLCPGLCPFSGVVSRSLSKFLYRILSLCLREPNLRLSIPEGSLGKILKQNLGARSPTSLLVMSPSSRMASQHRKPPIFDYSTIAQTFIIADVIPQLFERSREIKRGLRNLMSVAGDQQPSCL